MALIVRLYVLAHTCTLPIRIHFSSAITVSLVSYQSLSVTYRVTFDHIVLSRTSTPCRLNLYPCRTVKPSTSTKIPRQKVKDLFIGVSRTGRVGPIDDLDLDL